jgi:DNA-binding NtrC family response regulator
MSNFSGNEIDGILRLNAATGLSFRDRVRQATREIESQIILEALEQHRWNRRRAAETLRISYRLLMYKMKSCNLRADGPVSRTAAN